jgi:hypothetical protein
VGTRDPSLAGLLVRGRSVFPNRFFSVLSISASSARSTITAWSPSGTL